MSKTTKKEKGKGKAKGSKKAKKASKPAKAATVKASASKPEKLVVLKERRGQPMNPCLDGCGAMVKGKFKRGHYGTYFGALKAVVEGRKEVKDLPKAVQSRLRRRGDVVREFKTLAAM
jgi:hypothetical protein